MNDAPTTISVPLNLAEAERLAIEVALRTAGTIADAAVLLGITRHALKRRIAKHGLLWSRATRAAPGAVVETDASMDDAMAERKFNAR